MQTLVREAARIFHGQRVSEGAGVRLHRAFGGTDLALFDPFLLFDDFTSDREEDYRAGFPWHPHRGIETVTYLLGGEVAHRDSLGNQGSIGPGSVQWMSAGSGIIHEEMPVVGGARGASGRGESASAGIRGFQLWVNLPKAAKMSAPAYRDVEAGTIPEIIEGGARVRVIAGRYGGEGALGSARDTKAGADGVGGKAASAVEGAARNIAGNPSYLDVSLERDAAFAHPVAEGDTALLYVIEGRALIGERRTPAAAGDLVVTGAGALLRVEAPAEGIGGSGAPAARFLVMIGTPLREPVVWHGPIVMNTEEELRDAFAELRDGSFIKGH